MKSLNLENWLQFDPAIAMTVRLDAEGYPHPTTAADWLPPILDHTLLEHVPVEVRDLFETAKAAMLYGLLFTPLLALATEQLFRVCEAAAFHRASLAGAPEPHSKFRTNLTFLTRQGIINKGDQAKWQGIRNARDFASHPRLQMTVNPAIAIEILTHATEWVNHLFRVA